jgi:pseudouridine-5'-phosphate glycosidase
MHGERQERDAVTKLIAGVLEQADNETMKEIIGKAITPYVLKVVQELMTDQLTMEALQLRVKQQVIEATQKVTLNFNSRY